MLQKQSGISGNSRSLSHTYAQIVRVLTGRSKAEQIAEELERRFRRVIEEVSDYAILTLDVDGRVASWNEGVRRIKGYAPKEIIGKSFACFYPPEDIAAGRPAKVLWMAQQDGDYREEGWRVRKDGSRFWAAIVVSAIHDSDGRLTGYSKITRDLTDRCKAEQALARSNRLLEAIVDASPYSIIASDTQGLITSVNPAAERMLWYTREELLGKSASEQIHDRQEVIAQATELSEKYGHVIAPGLEAFAHESRAGLVEEREWTYIRKDGSRFPVHLAVTALRDDSRGVTGFVCIAYDISERRRREEYTQHIADHDNLTGLPNRALLYDRMSVALLRAARNKTKVGLLMVDLDHFKRINDSLGHNIGDQLLKVVAERILGCVRADDTVARMGGDEFVVLLPDLAENASADEVAAKIVKGVAMPIRVGEHQLSVTPSIGVSCYPDDGDATHTLLKNADAAMYSAKAAGRQGHRHFSRELERIADSKLMMEGALRKALHEQKLQVHYQPQMCLQTGRIIGMEALLRWRDPVKGEIPPKLFIPIAEESGLIVQIGEWVLGVACRDAVLLQKRAGRPLLMAVNVSARQFCKDNLQQTVREALDKSGLDPKLLELEITESVLMENPEESASCLHTLNALRALGVSLVLDDFGTGFSSLSYLTQFPINGLKIDRSFVAKVTQSKSDGAVVNAIIAMARSLDIKIVAEGVETEEQLLFLQSRLCDSVQGPLLGRSAPIEQFSAQGYRFSKALSMTQLCNDFDRLEISSGELIYASLGLSRKTQHVTH